MTKDDKEEKPCEFWIYPRNRKIGDPDWEAAFEYPNALSGDNGEQIHVIEYSAYDQLLAEAKKLVAALEFYADFANKNNHQFVFDDEGGSRAAVYEKYKKTSFGDLGMKAFEAIKDWTEKYGK